MSQKIELIGYDSHSTINKRRPIAVSQGQLQVGGSELTTIDQGINNLELYLDQVETKLTSIDTRIGDSVNAGTTEYGESANGRLNVIAYGCYQCSYHNSRRSSR